MRRLILLALAFTAAAVLVPTVAVADSATHTYLLEMGEPNLGVAANGEQIAITGGGEFSAAAKNARSAGLDRRTRNLPADDRELVPEHDNLQLLELLRMQAQ
jgi:hypothetical protein